MHSDFSDQFYEYRSCCSSNQNLNDLWNGIEYHKSSKLQEFIARDFLFLTAEISKAIFGKTPSE